MNFRQTRRSGRQIPADLLILSVLSLSVIFGMPIARILCASFPLVNKWIWFVVGVGAGFLILVVLYRLLELVANWYLENR